MQVEKPVEKEVIEYVDVIKYVDKVVSEAVLLLFSLALNHSAIAPDLSIFA